MSGEKRILRPLIPSSPRSLFREIEGSRLHYWLPTPLQVPTFCGTRFWASACSLGGIVAGL